MDAVEDYREWRRDRRRRDRDREDDGGADDPRRGRDRRGDGRDDDPPPRRRPKPASGAGWLVALVVVGALGLALIVPCLFLLPFVQFRAGAPQQNQQRWPGPPPGPNPPKWR